MESLFCEHPRAEVRYRHIKGGARVIQKQCIDCGRSVGSFISQKDKSEDYLQSLDPWDEELMQREYSLGEQRNAEAQARRQKESDDWWRWYNAYLLTPQWQAKRQLVLARDQYTCVGCGIRKAEQVHHLTYDHVGNELLFELASLCKPCHDICHHPHDRSGPPKI